MTIAKDLLGQWRGQAMGGPQERHYDVLVFKEDGSGFLDLYDAAHRFTERFRWSVEPPALLRLEDCQRFEPDPHRSAFQEVTTTRYAVVGYSIREEETQTLGRMRVLRFVPRPWPGMAETHRFYREDVLVYATFQAPCFVLPEEPIGSPFRGKALSDYLAKQLEARQIPVGPRQEVFFGCCYYRAVEMRGRGVGLAVNGDEASGGWWLLIDRPADGGTVEVEEFYHLLQSILGGIGGLHNLEWQTEAQWRGHTPVPGRDARGGKRQSAPA
jgi:hypothetical protein